MLLGLIHVVSPHLAAGELTYIDREVVDFALAQQQHEQYCQMLVSLGVELITLDVNSSLPDSCFVEDTAIVLDEIAIITSMGTTTRRSEPEGVKQELSKYREIVTIQLPATIEGGDVLRVGKTLFVGISSRTNTLAISELANIVKRFGYIVVAVPVTGCLHLKTACTAILDDVLLLNPAWIDTTPLQGYTLEYVATNEPWAANTIRVGNALCAQTDFPKTLERIQKFRDRVELLNISEFRKVEAGLSCLSILFNK